MRQWDFLHCPQGTNHVIIGAGEGPCLVLAAGARDRSTGPDWGAYTEDATAQRHGASVERETTDAAEAYARFPKSGLTRYRDGWLPDGGTVNPPPPAPNPAATTAAPDANAHHFLPRAREARLGRTVRHPPRDDRAMGR